MQRENENFTFSFLGSGVMISIQHGEPFEKLGVAPCVDSLDMPNFVLEGYCWRGKVRRSSGIYTDLLVRNIAQLHPFIFLFKCSIFSRIL